MYYIFIINITSYQIMIEFFVFFCFRLLRVTETKKLCISLKVNVKEKNRLKRIFWFENMVPKFCVSYLAFCFSYRRWFLYRENGWMTFYLFFFLILLWFTKSFHGKRKVLLRWEDKGWEKLKIIYLKILLYFFYF